MPAATAKARRRRERRRPKRQRRARGLLETRRALRGLDLLKLHQRPDGAVYLDVTQRLLGDAPEIRRIINERLLKWLFVGAPEEGA